MSPLQDVLKVSVAYNSVERFYLLYRNGLLKVKRN